MQASSKAQAAAASLRTPLAPAELTMLTAAAVAGLVWFEQVLALPTAHSLRGDAAEYAGIAQTFRSFSEAFHFAGGRSVGFPLVLYTLMRIFRAWHGADDMPRFLRFFAYVMCGIHVASVATFYATLRGVWRTRHARVLHPLLLALLLAYPGLIAHTAVLLTDTFAADLLMLGTAALLLAPATLTANLASGALGGALFAAATLCRPTYLAGFALACAFACVAWLSRIGLALRLVKLRALGAMLLPTPDVFMRISRWLAALVVAGALLALATLPCAARYQRTCLADPTIVPRLVPSSLRLGLDSPRAYWSHLARPLEMSASCAGCVALRDDTLTHTWAVSCHIDESRFAYGIPACVMQHPMHAALYLTKKAIGLFDSYAYHDYAVDLTPAWARLWTRPFGALAFAGVFAAFALLVLRARHLTEEELLLMTLALGQTAAHSFGHIEPRYGYGAVPFALYALALTHRELRAHSAWLRAGGAAGLLAAALLFLVQTHAWDTRDEVLQRIEAPRPRPRVITLQLERR